MRDLPVRIVAAPLDDPVVFVDGLAEPRERAVLELSHWPGNRTPQRYRDDLSSGAALRFARERQALREQFLKDATAIANDHYDTDGCLALFVLHRPEQALPRARTILDAAAAGDFFRWPSDEALALDAIIAKLSNSPDSPLAAATAGRPAVERWNLAYQLLEERLPSLLDGDFAELGVLAVPTLERAHEDRGWLAEADREEHARHDLCVWERRQRGEALARLPGRHALFGATLRDRVAVLVTTPDGVLARCISSTRSWFDLRGPTPLPRPDFEALAARLNALEGTTNESQLAWRFQPADGPSPELWFGEAGLEAFPEHNLLLRPSRLDPARIRSVLMAPS